IRDLHTDGGWAGASLIVLRGASLGALGIAEEIKAIRQLAPDVPFLFMSDDDDEEDVRTATELGARRHMPPTLSFLEMLAAIRFVSSGGTYIPPCVLSLWARPQQQAPNAGPTDSAGNPIRFSARQRQVLGQLRQGKPNKIISYELGMCES